MELAQEDSEDEDAAGIMCIEGFIELHSDLDEGILVRIFFNNSIYILIYILYIYTFDEYQ